MNQAALRATDWKLEEFLRSDLLPTLVGLIRAFPGFGPLLPQILQVRIVIDANIVQRELRWRLKSRRNPEARSALHEVLACGVLVAYAPHFLEEEIIEHAPRIGGETKRSTEDVFMEWQDVRKYICFYTARARATVDVSRTDPDDTAYIDTLEEIAARAIYTRDRDFLRTTAPVILVGIEDVLKRYARANSVRIAVLFGSSVFGIASIEALIALGRVLGIVVQAALRLPLAVQILILAAIIAAIAYPKSRAKLLELWDILKQHLAPAIWESIVQGTHQFLDATLMAEESYEAVQKILPPAKRHPLIFHARAVCLAAQRPLRLGEIVSGVIMDGYKPRSDRSQSYLLLKLREDPRFLETEAGWVIQGVDAYPLATSDEH